MGYSQIISAWGDLGLDGYLAGMIIFWVVSAAGRALPYPREQSSDFYLWFYQFTQILLANFELLMAKKGGSRAPTQ